MHKEKGKLKTITILFMGIFHIATIVAIINVVVTRRWKYVLASLTVWFLIGCLGVGVGFHRYFTHGGYKTVKAVEYFLAICGSLALQGGLIYWVATHRKHHQFAEQPGLDPHTPREGKFWAHMGWMLVDRDEQQETMRRYAPKLLENKFYFWLNKLHWTVVLLVGLTLLIFGNWQWAFWGTFVPVTVCWHFTWIVNSISHLWGSRPFKTDDNSTNNLFVALLSFGEGWHNNHHRDPLSARHGWHWYQFDPNWWVISLMRITGLAWDVRGPKTQ